jgi:hypothetical protein
VNVEPLPPEVADLLRRLRASPRLVAHLTLVHDVACTLTARLDAEWPTLAYDRTAVHMGAAIHAIGKTTHPEELTQPGHAHELAGAGLLRAQGCSARRASPMLSLASPGRTASGQRTRHGSRRTCWWPSPMAGGAASGTTS